MKSAAPRTTWRYRRWRAHKLAAAPLCAHCAAEGLTVAATELDHIVPLAHGGELMDEANVQPLCEAHHAAKTDRELLTTTFRMDGCRQFRDKLTR